jgi:tetratricopeptide (TPR) repeat protein
MRATLAYTFFIVMALFLLHPVHAEKTLAENYETLTYRLYTQQKWDSLIIVGEKAIAEGYDYYYMRARIGIAAFELQKYARAVQHLKAALVFNNSEPYIAELVFHSYAYSGREDEARAYLGSLPSETAKSIGVAMLRPSVYLETGPSLSNHIRKFDDERQRGNGLYSETYLNKNAYYFLAGSVIPVGYRWSVNLAWSGMDFNKRRRVDITYFDSLSGDYKVNQSEGYLSTSFLLGNRIKISPAIRISKVSYDNPLTSDDAYVQELIGPSEATAYYDVAYGGELSFLAPYWSVTAGFWALKVDTMDFSQATASFYFRPLGNLNLYTYSNLTYKHNGFEGSLIYHQMAGGKICNKLWAEAFYTHGDLTGTGENNLQVFYNAFDKVKNRYGLRLIYTLNDHLRFSLRGQVFTREGTELYYDETGIGRIYSFNYQTLSITGGASWNL